MRDLREVATFVGIDAHARQCSIKAISGNGQNVLASEVATEGQALRRALGGLSRPLWVMLEASTVAPLIRDHIERVSDRLIVCETRENRWIAKSEDKSDPADADRLARLLRLGEYKEVYVPRRDRQELRELVILAKRCTTDVTRAKNRIKSKYRQHGIPVRGTSVYSVGGRLKWLGEVRRPAVRLMQEVLYQSLDAAQARQDRIQQELLKRVRGTRVYKQLLTVPGFGPVVSSTFIAVIDDPWRFSGKRRLWKYAGLAVKHRVSGAGSRAIEGGSSSGNRLLKNIAMMAAHNAHKGQSRFKRHYLEMVTEGVEPTMALRTTARNILATALAMWKNGSTYCERK